MKISIEGEPKEIAALVLAVQGRQTDLDEIVRQLTDGFTEAISSVRIP